MTESIKEQEVREELSTEMTEEVVGGGKEFFGGGDFGGGETELCGGGDFGGFNSNGGGSKPAGGGSGSKPAAPDDGNEDDTDNIENINECGTQNIVNQGRNNKARGKIRFK